MNIDENLGTRAQEALKRLRGALGLTQQQLAVQLGRAVVTVARWETARPPSGEALGELLRLALESGQRELAHEFKLAMLEEGGAGATIEESTFMFLLRSLLRNRHIPAVAKIARTITRELHAGASTLAKEVQGGAKLYGADAEDLEYTITGAQLSLAADAKNERKKSNVQARAK